MIILALLGVRARLRKMAFKMDNFFNFHSYTNGLPHYLIMLIIYAKSCNFEKSIDGLVMPRHDQTINRLFKIA